MKARPAIVLVVVVSGVILLGWWVASRSPHLARQTLPNGTTLTLVTVRAGHKHESPAASLQQKLTAWLPARWRARLKVPPPPATYSEVSSNYLSVWLTVEKTNQASAPKFRLYIGDDLGNFTIDDEHHGRSVSTALRSNLWLEGLPVGSWPRRAENLRILVYPEHGGEMLAEFRVKNPRRDTTTPAWSAPPWPITVRDGELEFTLTSLWLGVGSSHRDWKLWAQDDPGQRYTRAAFRVTKQGEPQTNWNAHHVRAIRDATGNWSDGNEFNSIIRNGETMNQFRRPPPPADEAWQMTVEFSRVSGFSTDEVFSVQHVRVPPPGQSLRLATNYSFGPDRLKVDWDTRPSEEDKPVGFWAHVEPSHKDHKLTLLRATDDKGRVVTTKNSGGGQSTTYELLTLSPDATSVDLVFAFHRSRVVTFQVKPEFYRTEKK